MLRGRRIVDDSSDSDEEFPDIKDLAASRRPRKFEDKDSDAAIVGTPRGQTMGSTAKNGTVRRRKLGAVMVDNPLLRCFDSDRSSSSAPILSGGKNKEHENEERVPRKKKGSTTPQRIALRTRKTKPMITSVELGDGEFSEAESIQEETILEDFSDGDDDDASTFEASQDEDSSDDDFTSEFLSWQPPKSRRRVGRRDSSEREAVDGGRTENRSPSPSAQLLAEAIEAEQREENTMKSKGSKYDKVRSETSSKVGNDGSDLVDPLSKLRIHEFRPPAKVENTSQDIKRSGTPPSPTFEPNPQGLVSPSKKISRIPATPHPPHMDTFWDQEFIDEWNDEHSPKKKLFPPPATTGKPLRNSSDKKTESSNPKKNKTSEAATQRAAKKAFAQAKHEVAEKFLKELDECITDNQISNLAASTGGIRIEWSNKLNTTAGRANWRRETLRAKTESSETVRYRHHASIELAEKVIDDEHRLLNVIAHEFCHLATFMITGLTTNPHGKEFKSWAAKVTRVFGESRSIEVTTKHNYDIDFKYVWECTLCGLEFKRHSKSIHPNRHRCGSCKSELRQVKPVPRKNTAAGGSTEDGGGSDGKEGGGGVKKESEYQKFMKEQMKIVKLENAGIPQKDIMRLVASRWAAKKAAATSEAPLLEANQKSEGGSSSSSDDKAAPTADNGVAQATTKLTIIDLT